MVDNDAELSSLHTDITDCQGAQYALEHLLEGPSRCAFADSEHVEKSRNAVFTLLYLLRDKLAAAENSIHALQFGKYSSDDPRSKVTATPQ